MSAPDDDVVAIDRARRVRLTNVESAADAHADTIMHTTPLQHLSAR